MTKAEKDKRDLTLLTELIQAFLRQGISRQVAISMAIEKFKQLKLSGNYGKNKQAT